MGNRNKSNAWKQWRVLMTTTLIQSIICGILESYGAMLVPVMKALETFGENHRTVKSALIGSLASGCLMGFSPISSYLSENLGVALVGVLGGIIIFLATFLASFASTFFTLVITYGLMLGIGCSFLFITNSIIVSQVFSENSVVAFSMLGFGNGVMNAVMPHIMVFAVSELDLNGAIRTICLIVSPIMFLPFFWSEKRDDEIDECDYVKRNSGSKAGSIGGRSSAIGPSSTDRPYRRSVFSAASPLWMKQWAPQLRKPVSEEYTSATGGRRLNHGDIVGSGTYSHDDVQTSLTDTDDYTDYTYSSTLTEITEKTEHSADDTNSDSTTIQKNNHPVNRNQANQIQGSKMMKPKKSKRRVRNHYSERMWLSEIWDHDMVVLNENCHTNQQSNIYLNYNNHNAQFFKKNASSQFSESFDFIDSSTESQKSQTKFKLANYFTVFQNKGFLHLCVSMDIASLGYQVPNVHIINYTSSLGIQGNPQLLLTCLGGASCIGPLINPLFLDKFEHRISKFRIYQIFVLGYGITVIFLPLVNNYPLLMFVCSMIGYFDGSFSTLVGPIAIDFVGNDKASLALGVYYGSIAIPVCVAAPLAGFIFESLSSYNASFYIAGIFFLVGGFMLSFTHTKSRVNNSMIKLHTSHR